MAPACFALLLSLTRAQRLCPSRPPPSLGFPRKTFPFARNSQPWQVAPRNLCGSAAIRAVHGEPAAERKRCPHSPGQSRGCQANGVLRDAPRRQLVWQGRAGALGPWWDAARLRSPPPAPARRRLPSAWRHCGRDVGNNLATKIEAGNLKIKISHMISGLLKA